MLRYFAPFAALAFLLTAVPGAALAASAKPAAAAEPLDVTRDFYKALHAGDAKAAARLTASKSAEPALRSFVAISRAYRDLEAALAKRFGADAAAEVGYGRKVQAEIKSLLGATVEVEGASARVLALDGHTISTLRTVNGAWRVELEDALESAEGRAALAAQARASTAAAKQVVASIKAGKYEAPRAAIDDFEERVANATGMPRTAPSDEAPALPDGGEQL